MKTALIEKFTYRDSKVSIYLALDDDYRQREQDPYFFEITHPEIEGTYTDSFTCYPTYQAARGAALEAADRLARV